MRKYTTDNGFCLPSYWFINIINRLLTLCPLPFSLNMQDSGGRLQKHVLLKRDNGDVVSFYVRKMVYDSWPKQLEVPKKRPEPTENPEPKKEHAEGVQPKKKRSNSMRDTEDPEPKKRPEPTKDPEPKKDHAEGVRQKKKRSKKHANKENASVVE
jgi:RNA exonuclease 1